MLALVNSPALMPCVQLVAVKITSAVMVQTTKVSINVCVMLTSACLTGSLVFAAAAAIGAEPKPDSLENTPRATPNRIAAAMVAPDETTPRGSWD